ncbi:MAG: DUF4367 domain-containing protein [Terrisporobacter sp.]|uniref:DUF4367 domain-containing protein n=1 Tax=Terrisporobacter sp. TaxID=1965305 RepID=UPI002FCA105B
MSKIEITDELLYKHCPNVEKYIVDKIPKEEDIDYVYPKKFDRKIKKLIKEEERPVFSNKIYRYTRKVAMVFILITIGLFTLTMSVESLRIEFFNIIKEIHKEFTIYKFDDKSNDLEFKNMEPEYLPKGFKETDRRIMDDDILFMYSNGTDFLTYHYFKVDNSNLYLDTEDTKTTKVLINGVEGEYIEKEKYYTIIWEDAGYCYIVRLEYLDKSYVDNKYEELIKIAKNIKENKK